MIGVYDYTVVLTYLSLISGMTGIIVCLHGVGHPFLGVFFLLLSGLCDTFDGRVARRKAGRTEMEKQYGIQIDSLSDLIAFGVLPGCIGIAMLRVSERFDDIPRLVPMEGDNRIIVYPIILIAIVLFYVLAALIRLAYFNVLEEERSKKEGGGVNKVYIGLPVTSAALIYPTVLLLQFLTKTDLTLLYFVVMLVTAFLFIMRINITKPKKKGIWIMVAIGAVEFILLLVLWFCLRR